LADIELKSGKRRLWRHFLQRRAPLQRPMPNDQTAR
jgi:hypothetical protein